MRWRQSFRERDRFSPGSAAASVWKLRAVADRAEGLSRGQWASASTCYTSPSSIIYSCAAPPRTICVHTRQRFTHELRWHAGWAEQGRAAEEQTAERYSVPARMSDRETEAQLSDCHWSGWNVKVFGMCEAETTASLKIQLQYIYLTTRWQQRVVVLQNTFCKVSIPKAAIIKH